MGSFAAIVSSAICPPFKFLMRTNWLAHTDNFKYNFLYKYMLISTLYVPPHFICPLKSIFAVNIGIDGSAISQKECQIPVRWTWRFCVFFPIKIFIKKKQQNSMGQISRIVPSMSMSGFWGPVRVMMNGWKLRGRRALPICCPRALPVAVNEGRPTNSIRNNLRHKYY